MGSGGPSVLPVTAAAYESGADVPCFALEWTWEDAVSAVLFCP